MTPAHPRAGSWRRASRGSYSRRARCPRHPGLRLTPCPHHTHPTRLMRRSALSESLFSIRVARLSPSRSALSESLGSIRVARLYPSRSSLSLSYPSRSSRVSPFAFIYILSPRQSLLCILVRLSVSTYPCQSLRVSLSASVSSCQSIRVSLSPSVCPHQSIRVSLYVSVYPCQSNRGTLSVSVCPIRAYPCQSIYVIIRVILSESVYPNQSILTSISVSFIRVSLSVSVYPSHLSASVCSC